MKSSFSSWLEKLADFIKQMKSKKCPKSFLAAGKLSFFLKPKLTESHKTQDQFLTLQQFGCPGLSLFACFDRILLYNINSGACCDYTQVIYTP